MKKFWARGRVPPPSRSANAFRALLPVGDISIKVHVVNIFHLVIFTEDIEVHEEVELDRLPLPGQYDHNHQYYNCSQSDKADCPDWKVAMTSHLIAVDMIHWRT